MPAVRTPDVEAKSEILFEAVLPSAFAKLGGEVAGITQETNVFKPAAAREIARDKVRLDPVRHEDRARKPPGVRPVLHDVQMGCRMRQRIRDDIRKKDSPRRVPRIAEEPGERQQDSFRRDVRREIAPNAGGLERNPGLVDPALCAGDFSALLQIADRTRFPRCLVRATRQIFFRQIKSHPHLNLGE